MLLACVSPHVELGPAEWPSAEREDAGTAPAEDTGERLYVDGVVHDVALTLDEDARRVLERGQVEWVPATLAFEGSTWEVGVRLKGSSTFDTLDGKPSLKIDADRFVPDQKVAGHTKLDLNNQVIDPSMMSESMTYATYRAAGLPAPRTAYARLTIDGEAYGLYGVVEPPTDEFLRRWFGEDGGNLYENGWQDCEVTDPTCFDVEQADEGSHDALYALAEAAALEGAAWEQAVPALLDWDQFLGAMAMEAMLAHWDGYSYDLSNYRLYHSAGGFVFLPWSADLDYGWRPWSYPECGMYGVDPSDYDDGILALRCEESETCHAQLVERMASLVEGWEDPVGAVDARYALIREEVYADRRKWYDDRDFERHVECVRAWVGGRKDEIRAWVEGYGFAIQ
ncbi:MAG: CotH kinase family protein [Myxococcota bacterium]